MSENNTFLERQSHVRTKHSLIATSDKGAICADIKYCVTVNNFLFFKLQQPVTHLLNFEEFFQY